MAPLAAALLSALAAATWVQAVPAVSNRDNIIDELHEVERQYGGGSHRNFLEFEGWETFKAYGSNLGAWFEIETTNTPNIWIDGGANVTDEWTFCETVGKQRCGEVLEEHYRTFITNDTIDKLATVNVNLLRIPMTYAAWVEVPGSNLYSGNQQKYLREVTNYAITTYGMHVVIGLHSLPGGVNTLEIGEAFGRGYWFYNQTNFDYSLQAVDGILDFIQSSVAPEQFTISPINEPTDDFTRFASPESVSYPDGVNYVNAYIKAVYAKMQAVNPNLWLMQNDAFGGASRWTPYWSTSDKWLVEEHVYYFEVPGVYADTIPGRVCNETLGRRVDAGDFIVFVGEFSLQAQLNNTLAGRQAIYDSQVRAFQQYLSGGAFWTARFDGFRPVNGQGTQNDYWYFNKLIDEGIVRSYSEVNSTDYCRGNQTG